MSCCPHSEATGVLPMHWALSVGTGLTVHPDGSVEYPPRDADPPELNGYRRDQDNRRLFHPEWPPCRFRVVGPKISGGDVDLMAYCPLLKKFITTADCVGCEARE